MRKIIYSGLIAATMALSLNVSASMPSNSYLSTPAQTHQILMKQIENDPAVMDRYMRHFAMSRTEVIRFFRDLKLVRVPDDMTFVVYNVPKSGELRSKVLKFRKGTKIWVDRSGRPALKVSCGNPLTKGPVKAEALKISTVAAVQSPAKEVAFEDVPSEEVTASMTPFAPEVPEVTVEAAAIPVVEPTPPFVTEGSSNIPVVGAPWWLAIPVLGGAFAIIPKGGGTNPPPPVPEPSSYLALALGAGSLIVVMQRKKKPR